MQLTWPWSNTSDGRDVDDRPAALLLHDRHYRPHRVEYALNIDFKHLLELFLRDLQRILQDSVLVCTRYAVSTHLVLIRRPSVIYANVKSLSKPNACLHRATPALSIRDIQATPPDARVVGTCRYTRSLVTHALLIDVYHHHGAPFLGKTLGDGCAKAGGGTYIAVSIDIESIWGRTCDQGYLAFKPSGGHDYCPNI